MANPSVSTTAVDLSRLPAPTLIEELSFETLYAEHLALYREKNPDFDAVVESDPVIKALQVGAYRELMLRQRVNDAARQLMVAYATGSNLDHLLALFEVPRLELAEGDTATGVDPTYEQDDDYRARGVLAPEGYSVAGPEGAYKFKALSAHSDVLDASATSPAPGEVVVTVLSRTAPGVPSSEVLSAVDAAVSADTARPLTDQVTVQAANIIPYEIQAEIFTFSGPDITVVTSAAEAGATAYAADCHRLGRDVTRSGLTAAMHVVGVQRVNLQLPPADVVISRVQAPLAVSQSIIHAGYAE
ncbi:MAG: baseplate assembly protein [Phage 64_12]|nr:MAG: baseplate assembly protein [Phage 64_12]